MYACPDVMKMMHAYLDGELDVKESIRVQTHLQECSICRDAFASEQAFLGLLRSHMSATPAPAFARHRVSVALARDTRGRRRECRGGFARHAAWLAVSGAVAAVLGAVALSKLTASAMPGMVRWAVAEHQAYVRDPDSLALHSSDPQAVSRWLEDRLHFSPDLPPERVKGVMLVGAQAVAEGGNHAAHLVYRLGDDTVSLLLTPPQDVRFSSRDVIAFKNIFFHPADVDGYHTLQWSDHRHTYVLVSEGRQAVYQACAICHSATVGRDIISGFRSEL